MVDPDGGWLFDREFGLRAYLAMRAIVGDHADPLGVDADGRFWAYHRGVWSLGQRIVDTRVARTLGERYRPQHQRAIEHLLRVELPVVEAAPVPNYINLPNGMLRWDAPGGPALLEHHSEYLSTVQLPVAWDPDAVCPAFDAFLEASVPADDRQRVWEMLGYLMMSGNPLQRLFLLYGGGGNGKGVLLHVIKGLLGAANTSAVPLHDFAESQFATAELFGKLANICGDIDATFIEHTGRIKEMAGEDQMKGERKFGQPFYFEFWGKAIFSANGIPAAADSSHGWVRRWEVVGFPYEPAAPDRRLKARLTESESLQGIARKAVDALRVLMERGDFDRGQTARESHQEFAHKSNRILLWIHETMILDGVTWHNRVDLLQAFRRWDAVENPSSRTMAASLFYERLRQIKGLRPAKRRGVNGFVGLGYPADGFTVDLTGEAPSPPGGGIPHPHAGLPAQIEIKFEGEA
jgi:P4 family phage/plasmid primase-like protien